MRSGAGGRSQASGEMAAREVNKWMMKYRSVTYAGLYFHVVVAHPLPGYSLVGGGGSQLQTLTSRQLQWVT